MMLIAGAKALKRHRIFTISRAKLSGAKKHYQKYLAPMPRALEELDLSAYDLVFSCEAGPAKGVITRPDVVHVTYCHSPMRYIWVQYHAYVGAGGRGAKMFLSKVAPRMRIWDQASATRPDQIMANSHFVRPRIRKFWGPEATVVYPPVHVEQFHQSDGVTDEFIWVGKLVPYKRLDIAVDAFTCPGRKLHVISDGSILAEHKTRTGPNVRFTTRMKFDQLREDYATAHALVFTAQEGFGIIPVESQAAGRPVLVYGRGGGRKLSSTASPASLSPSRPLNP